MIDFLCLHMYLLNFLKYSDVVIPADDIYK